MATRALPDLVARIRVDSTGVDNAMTNLVGSFGRANMELAAAGAAIGVLIMGGKSMVEITEKHDKAERSLAQAIESRNAATGPVIADMTKVIAATEHLHLVTRQLAEFDAGHKGHKMTTLDLMHRQDAVAKVTAATEALSQAQKDANRISQETVINSATMQSQLDEHIKTNRRFIKDQSEVVDGAAKLVRSGLTQAEVQKDLERAVDLSALKHISLSEAVDLLVKAEQGRLKGLIDLGISTGKFTDSQGNLVNGTKDVSRAMAELDEKLLHGRDTLSKLQQAQNGINQTWQAFAIKYGPQFLDELTNITKGVDQNMPTWLAWLGTLNDIGNQLAVLDPKAGGAYARSQVDRFGRWANQINGKQNPGDSYVDTSGYGPGATAGGKGRQDGRALGGLVLPNSIYTVGERGPETLVMGPQGGMVIPNAAGGGGAPTINVYVNNPRADAWEIARELNWAMRTRKA